MSPPPPTSFFNAFDLTCCGCLWRFQFSFPSFGTIFWSYNPDSLRVMLTSHDHFVSFDFPSFFLAEGVIYYEMLQTSLFFPLFLKATQESSLVPLRLQIWSNQAYICSNLLLFLQLKVILAILSNSVANWVPNAMKGLDDEPWIDFYMKRRGSSDQI